MRPGTNYAGLKGGGNTDFLSGAANWLGERPPGATTEIGEADPTRFITPGGIDRANRLNDLAAGYDARIAPQSANASDFRGYQDSLAQRLSNQVNGADSLSQLALRNATDANIAQQRSLAAGATPGNAAMAQRMAMQNIGQMNQGYGAQAAQLGIQERNAAANALAQLATQGRGQDIQGQQFNVDAALRQQGMNDQAAAQARQQELANAELRQRGSMGYEQNQTVRRGQDLGVPTQPANWERVVAAGSAALPFFMAEGGVVTQPTNAVVGEAGPEAVIPLGQLPALVSRIIQHMRSAPPPGPEPHTGMSPGGQRMMQMYRRNVDTPAPQSPVSVVSHGRDRDAELPFVQAAAADDLEQQARMLRGATPWMNVR